MTPPTILTQNGAAPSQQFPMRLLNASSKERIDYFNGLRFAHPRLTDCQVELLRAVQTPAHARILLVMGPGGAGKTTLLEETRKALLLNAREEMERDVAHIPVVIAEV